MHSKKEDDLARGQRLDFAGTNSNMMTQDVPVLDDHLQISEVSIPRSSLWA